MLNFKDAFEQAQKDDADEPAVELPHDESTSPFDEINEEVTEVLDFSELQSYIDKVAELQANRHPEDIPLDDKYWEALNDLRQFHAGNR